jgi:hypothetical protein
MKMNITKIQSNLLTFIVKQNYSDKERKSRKFCYSPASPGTQRVGIIEDGNAVYLIKEKDFVIDLSKWENTAPISIKNITKEADNAKYAQMTCERRAIPGTNNETIAKIANDTEHAWVNEKYLKMFDKGADFQIINWKSPVFVYEHGEMVGFVLPICIAGESDDNGK